jgi:hypothetical protein
MNVDKTTQEVVNITNGQKVIFWKRWESKFGEPKTGTIKYALLNRKETKFNQCVRIINGRIYLDIESTHDYFNSCKED